jgi:phosphoketolase
MTRQSNGALTGADYEGWSNGYGVIAHAAETKKRIAELADRLVGEGIAADHSSVLRALAAADRLANAGMWTVAHMTYALRVDPTGQALAEADFKPVPEGHTGGSLNMVPAYVGYLAANVLTARTRSWIMGQGHCVAAIEAVNTLVGNLSPAQAGRYDRSSEGLSRLARDFYSYAVAPDGRPAAPLGSHVNVHTGGGISEGGYLGFAEVEYVHMPLPGDSLVAFLSDGAFEEQRGSDWSPRWWRAEDCGAIAPIMILNGRRIEQRTQIAQEGGADWLKSHLQMSGFDPIEIDGHDPASYAWAIIEIERRLSEAADRIRRGEAQYPVRLPYAIAHAVKGFGFPGAGTNRAHNLPLAGNPRTDKAARQEFAAGAKRLFVPMDELEAAMAAFAVHQRQARPKEADHALVRRNVILPVLPDPEWQDVQRVGQLVSPMDAIDEYFVHLVGANPGLRPRVGNPDELRSNHMGRTLDLLKHRVNRPEPGAPEAVDGAVITALNEEAVIGAVLGNKAGLNLAVSYEAFAVKMLGALRQEIIFARHQREAGHDPGWIGVPLIATSHVWENGKNEQSHQDPTIGEAMLGEMSDVSRVLFPIDANSAIEALRRIYSAHGQIGCIVVPKRALPPRLDGKRAIAALDVGAALIAGSTEACEIQLVAIGAYQLGEALRAWTRLIHIGRRACVTCVIEPGRIRSPRDELEKRFVINDSICRALFPSTMPRVIITHTRPEPMLGILRRLDGGPARTRALGFLNHGGTLDVGGMLFANRCTWAHIAAAAADLLGLPHGAVLDTAEMAAISGTGDPLAVVGQANFPEPVARATT